MRIANYLVCGDYFYVHKCGTNGPCTLEYAAGYEQISDIDYNMQKEWRVSYGALLDAKRRAFNIHYIE